MKAGPEIDGSVCLGLNVTSEPCSLASFCLVYFIYMSNGGDNNSVCASQCGVLHTG